MNAPAPGSGGGGGENILLVDDDPAAIQLLARILAGLGPLRFAACGEDALRLARESPPDLMLLDAEMPGISGFEVCLAMKVDRLLADVPVIFVTSHCGADFEVSGFDVGASDFIAKPFSAPLVLARVKAQLRLKHLGDRLRRIATIDVLTGVANRRHFDEALVREWRSVRRSGDALALLMIDVDHFKAFTDRYGHPAGDECLRRVAEALVGAGLRPSDLVARYGGEEFVMLLPRTPRAGAEYLANGVLDAIAMLQIEHGGAATRAHVSVSIGAGCYDEDSACWEAASIDSRFSDDTRPRIHPDDLVQAADRALYAAKHGGRAQARLLDMADARSSRKARAIWPSSHPGDAA
ncbi:MAG: diguanylate cyclase [Burkholderiaceae bacterium]